MKPFKQVANNIENNDNFSVGEHGKELDGAIEIYLSLPFLFITDNPS
jgi:hypothetical protein